MADKVSGSRLGRLSKLAWMSRKAIPLAVRRFTQRGDAPEAENPIHLAAAEEILAQLGQLKGLAMKMGQMMSYMDNALPADAEPAFRRVLMRLQRDAPSFPWSAIEAIVRADLGSVEQHFASLEPEPFAAASIGQVHRGVLHDGTEVAVKVQYPGIADAVRADLSNLGMVETLARPLLGVFGASGNLEMASNSIAEIKARLLEELDYEHEAAMQLRFRELIADTPGAVIPYVYREHSSARVLTSEFVHGKPLSEVASTADAELRNRWAEVMTRVVSDGLYVHHLFNADPHPGNYLFRDDGSVVFLDFGCVKEIDPAMAEDMMAYLRAAIVATATEAPADWRAFDAALSRALRLESAEPAVFVVFRELTLYVLQPLLRDQPFEFTTAYTGGVNDLVVTRKRELVFGGGRLPKIPKVPPIPGDYTFLNRLQWGFYSVLTELRATVNWHRLLPAAVREPISSPEPGPPR